MKKRFSWYLFLTLILGLCISFPASSQTFPDYIDSVIDPGMIQVEDVTPLGVDVHRVECSADSAYAIGQTETGVALLRSTDLSTWTQVSFFPHTYCKSHGSAGLMITRLNTILLSVYNDTSEYLLRSADGGATYETVRTGDDCVFIEYATANDGTIYLQSYGGLYIRADVILASSDDGRTWSVFYDYPPPGPPVTSHCEALAYHEATNRLYASFGHAWVYTFGYCDLDTGEWTWQFTQLYGTQYTGTMDMCPQQAPNTLEVISDYVVAGNEPVGASQTVCMLDGETFLTTSKTNSAYQYGVSAAKHKGVCYLATCGDINKKSSIYAVIPRSGLWVELIRANPQTGLHGFVQLSETSLGGWVFCTFLTPDSLRHVVRFTALTETDVVTAFQQRYVDYSSVYDGRMLNRTVLAFFPETSISFADAPLVDYSVRLRNETAASEVEIQTLDTLEQVSGTAFYAASTGGLYSEGVVQVIGNQGETLELALDHPPTPHNRDIMSFVVLKLVNPRSVPQINVDLYLNDEKFDLGKVNGVSRGETMGLNGWLWVPIWHARNGVTNTKFVINFQADDCEILVDAFGYVVSNSAAEALHIWALGFGRDWDTKTGSIYRPCDGVESPTGISLQPDNSPMSRLNVVVPPRGSSHVKVEVIGTPLYSSSIPLNRGLGDVYYASHPYEASVFQGLDMLVYPVSGWIESATWENGLTIQVENSVEGYSTIQIHTYISVSSIKFNGKDVHFQKIDGITIFTVKGSGTAEVWFGKDFSDTPKRIYKDTAPDNKIPTNDDRSKKDKDDGDKKVKKTR